MFAAHGSCCHPGRVMAKVGDVLHNASEHQGIGGKLWLFTVFLPRQYKRPSSLCRTPESQKETSISQVSNVNERDTLHRNSFGKSPSSCPGQSDNLWQPDQSACSSPLRPLQQHPSSGLPHTTGVRCCGVSARLKPVLQRRPM